MMDSLSPLLLWLNDNPNWGVVVTFLISTMESVAIIGTVVPGSIMMTAIGALAGAGVIPLWPTIISAILGAIVGDGVSYLLGHYFKTKIPHLWPFSKHPEWLLKGEDFFHKHGGKSVFIGRFVGPVRALIPMVAGMLNMKPLRFYIFNITSAIGWAPLYMLPGILLGAASLELPPDIAVHVILMLLLVSLFIILCIWLIIKIFSSIGYKIDRILNCFWYFLNRSHYGKFITIPLKHYDPHRSHGQLVLAFYLILISISFFLLGHHVMHVGSSTIAINDIAFHLFRSLHTPLGDKIMLSLTLLGEKIVLVPVTFIIFGWLIFTKRYYVAWHTLLLLALITGSVEIVKHLIHSTRPWGTQTPPHSFSFPSGHTALASTFFIGFALLLSHSFPSKKRYFCIIAVIIAFLISISRLYLGVHWFTDVCGGWLISAATLLIVVISYQRKADPETPLYGLITITFTTLILSYSFAFSHYYTRYQTQLTVLDYPQFTLSTKAWWDQTDKHIPIYRIGRFGIAEQVFNLQWAGNLKQIQSLLLDNNWELPPNRDWISVIQRIADVQSTEHLPLVSPLYLDKKPVLVLIKHTENKKRVLVLRLWDSNLTLKNGNIPLWIGTVSVIPRTYNWIFRKKINESEVDPELLFETNPTQYEIKKIKFSPEKSKGNNLPTQVIILLVKPKT